MKQLIVTFTLAAAALATQAQPAAPVNVNVDGAWARAAGQGQVSSGAYMALTAREPLRLVGASSPAAGIVELHQMKMDGDVMKMRAVDALELPVGQAVELKPGGYHLMLMDLKLPFKPDARIPLTLRFRDAKGAERSLQLSVPVAFAPPHAHKP
jgi:copper(I)-binding protein